MELSAAVDAYFLSKDFTPTSKRWYAEKLNRFSEWCQAHGITEIESITTPHVRQFLAYVRTTPSPRYGRLMSSHTLHGFARGIKGFLNWCIAEDLVAEKVTRRIEMPKREQKVIQTFTKQHIDKLFTAANHPNPQYPWFIERDKAILAVLLDTGIRANELCDLTLDRVFLSTDDTYLLVNGKGRKQREAGLGQQSRLQFHCYIHRYRPHVSGEQHVFLTRDHKPLHPEGLDRLLYRLRDIARIEGIRVSAHSFRHTFAVNYLKAGGDVYKLSRLLGRTSVVITEGYLRSFQSREARRGLSVFDDMRMRG